MQTKPDIVIFGAGIAGLWLFHALKKLGYDVLLLEKNAIGCGQTIAAQGIIHSGLKFTLAGKVNALAQSISAMPEIWRTCLSGRGPVDLSHTKINAPSQLLLIPSGFIGGITKLVTEKTFGDAVKTLPKSSWPQELQDSGFQGSAVSMAELVLDIPSVLRALAEPYKEHIRLFNGNDPFDFLEKHNINPKTIIFTMAEDNYNIAKAHHHDSGLQIQKRPLLQGLLKPAPFPLYAHLVGTSEKPVATITTHKTNDNILVWYIGAAVAERTKESDPNEVYAAIQKAFQNYLPHISLKDMEWAVHPIDRIEGKSKTDHWMPDTPTIHKNGNVIYAWPTKLTFAPLLSDMIIQSLDISPSQQTGDYHFLSPVDYALTPWDTAIWRK